MQNIRGSDLPELRIQSHIILTQLFDSGDFLIQTYSHLDYTVVSQWNVNIDLALQIDVLLMIYIYVANIYVGLKERKHTK
jgi:hypothetical protein